MTTQLMQERLYNFSAGPAVMPVPVLEQLRDEMLCLPNAGCSILEISHRSPQFESILHKAKDSLRDMMAIPESHEILFLQGGSRLQFGMVPLNLCPRDASGVHGSADYFVTGSWSEKAWKEAAQFGPTHVAWNGKKTNFDRLPSGDEIDQGENPAYVYFASNETIQGVQFPSEPDANGAPLICDASSDFLSRPVNVERYGIIYACAQKNAGPAGLTIVVIRKDLLERTPQNLPGYMDYNNHAREDSMYNTPPTFAIYAFGLVCKWLQETIGGLDEIDKLNRRKSALLYDVIDQSDGFYIGHAQTACRSNMNVTFRLTSDDRDKQFLDTCRKHGLTSLGGHRSVKGVRASIYNAMPVEGVQALADLMTDFARNNG